MKNRALFTPAVCLFLAAAVFLIYGQTLGHEFIDLDDDTYIIRNPEVNRGLSFQGIGWAFTHCWSFNWHPLTWISHMADCQLYGLHPGGPHLTNLLLHAAVAILLFLVLREMTAAPWRSAFVAALFAVHPLRVESVAWVAERKDLLGGLFFMLTLAAYLRYVRRPPSLGNYLLVLLCFALGLMSKQSIVALPFLLLLLDAWPLGRFPLRPFLIVEKLPLLALSAAACAATVIAQQGMIVPLGNLPLSARLGNVVVSYAAYLSQMVWPWGLELIYPWNGGHAVGTIVAASLLLLGASAGCWRVGKKWNRPYLLVGWGWYLGMLVPMIGLVQVGVAQRADRYTYLPEIGIAILLTWGIADLSFSLGARRRPVLVCASAVVLAALALVSFRQVSYWRDSVSLWNRSLAVTPGNLFAEDYLGRALYQQGRLDEAVHHLQRVDAATPGDAVVSGTLGCALLEEGQPQQALPYLQRSARIDPANPAVGNYLAVALYQTGEIGQGIAQWQRLLVIHPEAVAARYNLGKALLKQGRDEEGIVQLEAVLQSDPSNLRARDALAAALAAGRESERLSGGGHPDPLFRK